MHPKSGGSIQEVKELPTVDELLQFISDWINTLPDDHHKRNSHKSSSHCSSDSNTYMMQTKTTSKPSCPACGDQHTVYKCSTFRSWSQDRRHSFARKHKLCFNCLGQGHSIQSCMSRRF